MAKWRKDVYRLENPEAWQAKEGYQIFVADQGAVRFDFPETWVMLPGDTSFKFYDQQPPDDNCLLEMSIFHLPAGPDWSQLPLKQLLMDTVTGDTKDVLSRGEAVYLKRGDLEIAWLETCFVDPGEHREARSRCCLARRGNIQPLFTFAFWPEDAERVTPVWDEVLRTLRLGEFVAMPIRRGRN